MSVTPTPTPATAPEYPLPAPMPDLADAADRHLRWICALERLADLGGDLLADNDPARGDRTLLTPGMVVFINRRRVARAGLLAELGTKNSPYLLRVAWLPPSALDQAQRTWAARSREILAPDYVRRRIDEATATVSDDVTARWQAAYQAYRDALFSRAVATGCGHRPWAAVVAPQYTELRTDEVHRHPDQSLAGLLPA